MVLWSRCREKSKEWARVRKRERAAPPREPRPRRVPTVKHSPSTSPCRACLLARTACQALTSTRTGAQRNDLNIADVSLPDLVAVAQGPSPRAALLLLAQRPAVVDRCTRLSCAHDQAGSARGRRASERPKREEGGARTGREDEHVGDVDMFGPARSPHDLLGDVGRDEGLQAVVHGRRGVAVPSEARDGELGLDHAAASARDVHVSSRSSTSHSMRSG